MFVPSDLNSILLSDDHIAPQVGPDEPPEFLFTQKGRTAGCPAALEDTHTRLFNRQVKEKPANLERMQELRNREMKGRRYDIITGAEVQVMPSNIPECHNRFKGHPSLTLHSSYR